MRGTIIRGMLIPLSLAVSLLIGTASVAAVISGTVTDGVSPIGDAGIVCIQNGLKVAEGRTDSSGNYTVPVTNTVSTIVRAAKSGKKPSSQTVATPGTGNPKNFVLAARTAGVNTFYCRVDGSDTNDGEANSATRAWKRMDVGGSARDILMPGDTVIVQPGTYTGGLVLNNVMGSSAAKITFQGVGNPIISEPKAQEGTGPSTIDHRALVLSDCSYLVIDGITFTNGSNVNGDGTISVAVAMSQVQHLEMRSCIINPSDKLYDQYSTACWAAVNMDWGTDDIYFHHNLVWCNTHESHAVRAYTHGNLKFYNNTFEMYGHSQDALVFDKVINGQVIEFKNNIVVNRWGDGNSNGPGNILTVKADPEGSPVRTADIDHTNNLFCKYDSNGVFYGGLATAGAAETTLLNPLFISDNPWFLHTGPDFNLSLSSAAVNTGTNLGFAYKGAAPDKGCYELDPATWHTVSNLGDAKKLDIGQYVQLTEGVAVTAGMGTTEFDDTFFNCFTYVEDVKRSSGLLVVPNAAIGNRSLIYAAGDTIRLEGRVASIQQLKYRTSGTVITTEKGVLASSVEKLPDPPVTIAPLYLAGRSIGSGPATTGMLVTVTGTIKEWAPTANPMRCVITDGATDIYVDMQQTRTPPDFGAWVPAIGTPVRIEGWVCELTDYTNPAAKAKIRMRDNTQIMDATSVFPF